ncbi:MAG TPA: biotin carboxylase N-terminal domain-containing protein, partial [Ilumatobacteraceae bacterium]|nr:biotin carboxylase N-terminal domain-containing protein [Ilumatobacteraceae bacterium]
MATISRLGVIDTGESAVRVLESVGGLNSADDAPPITTLLFHADTDPQPWYAREADEVHRLGDEPELASVEDLVACLQRARVDTLWLGAWRPAERLDLIALCEAGGIGVVGPRSSTVRRLADLAATAGARAVDSRLRRVEVDILADDHANVWTLG